MRRLVLVMLAGIVALAVACGDDAEPEADRTGITTRTPVPGDSTPRPAVTPRAASTPRPSTSGPALPGAAMPGQAELEWAAAFCEVTAGFDDAVIAMQDGLNPRELDFDERKERAINRYTAYAEAAEAGAARMQQFSPPPEAMAYHDSVGDQLGALARLFETQIERIEAAEDHEHINAAVEQLQREVDEIERPVRIASGLLSDSTVRALQSMPRCGTIVG